MCSLHEIRNRALEDHAEAFGIDAPAHDVERVGPELFAGCLDARRPAVAGAQHDRGGAVAEQAGGDDIGLGQFVMADRERAELERDQQHIGARAAIAPAARRSTGPIRRPRIPSPNTGTREISPRKPISPATRASSVGVAMPVEQTVTTVSISPAERSARASALRATSTNKRFRAFQKGLRPLRPAAPLADTIRSA